MGLRGPKVVVLHDRAAAPGRLTKEEAEVWATTVEGLPVEWFRPEQLPLLEQYCVHVCRVRQITQMIRDGGSDKAGVSLGDLYRMEMAETKMVAFLATKMRLTQQSTLAVRKSKHGGGPIQKPWERDSDVEEE